MTRKKQPVPFTYQLDSANLLRVQEEKDLGVTLTSNLSWDPHIYRITAKANKLLGLREENLPPFDLRQGSENTVLVLSEITTLLCQ